MSKFHSVERDLFSMLESLDNKNDVKSHDDGNNIGGEKYGGGSLYPR